MEVKEIDADDNVDDVVRMLDIVVLGKVAAPLKISSCAPATNPHASL